MRGHEAGGGREHKVGGDERQRSGGRMRLPGCCETGEHKTGVGGHEAGGESDAEATSGGRTVLEGRSRFSGPLDLSINPPHIGMTTYRHGKASHILNARFLVQETGGRLPAHGFHDT